MLAISVVIPTLNEGPQIQDLLQYLERLDPNLDLIVADGDSNDDTVERAQLLARVVPAPRGRGAQMNAGAEAATGEILWFIHADCRPHADSVKAIQQVLTDRSIVGGGFEYDLDQTGFRFRLTVTTSNLKNRILKWLFGDMGIFVRSEVFEQLGGYKEIPLMEDMDFCKRLKRMGKIVILPLRMQTSARRWLEEGWGKVSIRSWLLQTAWAVGVSPHWLARWYRFK